MPEANQRRPQSMVRRFRRCLIFVSLFCVVCAALGAAVLLQNKFTDAMLTQSCRTVARALETGSDMERLAVDSEVRYTLIDHSGAVLFDSEVAEVSALENHAGRPEVQAAFAAGQGVSTRQSKTLDRQTRYFALRLDGDRVLRAAVDVPNLLGMLLLILPTLAAVCLPVFGMAAVLSFWLTRRMVQPITHMAQHLDTIEADVPYEELIPLAHTVQADRQLQADNEAMRREFTANVSHELKTPLTSISGYAELLETRMARPEDVPEFGRRIHKEAGRMISLVSDILQLSELDGQQRQNFEPAPVDLAALVRDTAANMTMNARKAYVTLQYTAPDTPLMVQGGRDLLADWLLLCPPEAENAGFYYDYHDENGWELSDTRYTLDDPDAWENPGNAWFIDAYSRTFPLEDRARIFETLFLAGEDAPDLLSSPHLLRKAQYLCAILRERYESLRDAPPLYWERHITPIPYADFVSEFEALDIPLIPIGRLAPVPALC